MKELELYLEKFNLNNDCPICSEKAVDTCACKRRDSSCTNGHDWHTCIIHKERVVGKSNKDDRGCTCKDK